MNAQRALACFLMLAALASCGERVPRNQAGGGSTTPPIERADDPSSLGQAVTPVRVGELGPNFAACAARGAARERASPVSVRAAPFENGEPIDRLSARAEFFICSRTLDQRWFGIVYDEGGVAAGRCGVDRPIAQRRVYGGPCAAGWVQSSSVALISGEPHQLPSESTQAPPSEIPTTG